MPKKPISGVTDGMFLSENEVYDVIQQYMPSETLKQNDLAEWMSKDGFWGPAKRKQVGKTRKRGRLDNIVKPKYRDFTWDDICNIQQFRAMVKASLSSIRTSGYGRKSPSQKETQSARENTVGLQICKLKTKLLCEDVFASIGTSAFDPLGSRDHGAPDWNLKDCSGNTQTMIQKITKSERKARLVTIVYRDLTTNIDDQHHFPSSRKHRPTRGRYWTRRERLQQTRYFTQRQRYPNVQWSKTIGSQTSVM